MSDEDLFDELSTMQQCLLLAKWLPVMVLFGLAAVLCLPLVVILAVLGRPDLAHAGADGMLAAAKAKERAMDADLRRRVNAARTGAKG